MMMTTLLDTEKAWRAVQTRDRRADGAFVYAVRSTGIYCRPSCPSRRPARRNVRFYRDPAGAELEGFRPCRRCGEAVAPQRRRDLELVRRVCEVLGDNGAEAMPLNRLATACRTSPFALRRTFKRVTGVSPRAYAEALRFRTLKRALRKERTVSAATFVAGFGSSSRLYERAGDRLGMTPAAYRLGATGTEIRYSLISTTLGTALVGATQRGVCAVKLGSSGAELERDLRAEFPGAILNRDDAELETISRRVAKVIDGAGADPELPLDIQGTAFQARVWRALTRIPQGETRTYTEVAQSIGRPSAVRAVASACAANHLAVLIPCHRVVLSDGGMGGYRWGEDRKRTLLERERHA